MIFGANDVLAGFQWNEEARAFAVGNDARDGEGMIDESDGVADFDVARLGDDVVGERFVRSLERAASAKDKTLTEGVEAFVINAKDVCESFGVRDDERRGRLVDIGKRGDLVAEGFRHDGAGKREENRGVGRLNEKIGADAFDALAPLRNDAAGEADDHQNQNNLDGNGKNAESTTQGTRGEIAPKHPQERKRAVVGVWHRGFDN